MKELGDKAAIMNEEEFLNNGGSQVTIDLCKLIEKRIKDVIHLVSQLATDDVTMLAIHSTAVMSAVSDHYVFLSCWKKELQNPEEFTEALTFAIKAEANQIFKHMSEKEKNGKTRFENVSNRER